MIKKGASVLEAQYNYAGHFTHLLRGGGVAPIAGRGWKGGEVGRAVATEVCLICWLRGSILSSRCEDSKQRRKMCPNVYNKHHIHVLLYIHKCNIHCTSIVCV